MIMITYLYYYLLFSECAVSLLRASYFSRMGKDRKTASAITITTVDAIFSTPTLGSRKSIKQNLIQRCIPSYLFHHIIVESLEIKIKAVRKFTFQLNSVNITFEISSSSKSNLPERSSTELRSLSILQATRSLSRLPDLTF